MKKTRMLKRVVGLIAGLAISTLVGAQTTLPADAKAAASNPGTGVPAKKVYTVDLSGIFGQDISQTPIRQAVKDAKKLEADYIIFTIDNDWSMQGGMGEDKPDDAGAFDELFRAEAMETTFTEEIQHEWASDKQPQVIFWVKKAMGGACFLPFNAKTIYFSSEGKMGGIGGLERIFGQMGDQVVREKQFSLRLKHAEGRAIQGGYDPLIVRAMARTEYVLSYHVVGGKPEFLERMPVNPDEILLTDDGDEQNGRKDSIQELARGEGNDCLTLTAKLAYDLGVSKGTVDTMEDLLFQLGISRNHTMVKSQSAQIMKTWRDGLESARRQLPKLWEQVGKVEVKAPGQYQQRTQARGARKKLLNDMQAIERKYEEALNPRALRVPGIADIDTLKKQIDLEQLADKPEKK